MDTVSLAVGRECGHFETAEHRVERVHLKTSAAVLVQWSVWTYFTPHTRTCCSPVTTLCRFHVAWAAWGRYGLHQIPCSFKLSLLQTRRAHIVNTLRVPQQLRRKWTDLDEIWNNMSQMWGWPWQNFGRIREIATVWEESFKNAKIAHKISMSCDFRPS